MTIALSLIGIFWIIFLVVWFVSAFGSKKTVNRGSWWYGAIIRIVFLVIIFLLIKTSDVHYAISLQAVIGRSNLITDVLGAILCGTGIAFAIWARFYLGKNWGMPMSLKENPQLVTSGPYRFVRHPIYTGMLFATFGSALAIGTAWFVVFVAAGIYFIYSATVEEKIMTKQFPDQYPAYKERTKMLIPFLF